MQASPPRPADRTDHPGHSDRPGRTGQLIVGLVVVVFGILVLWASQDLEIQSGYAGVGPGALQLAARVNGFTADPEAFTRGWADPARSARKAFAWGVALNWWLNRNVRQAVSYERTTFEGGAAQGADRPAENALLVRSQLSF